MPLCSRRRVSRFLALTLLLWPRVTAWAGETPAVPDGAVDYALEALPSHASRDLLILHNDLFPGFLVRVKGGQLHLFRDLDKVDLEGPRHLACVSGGGVKVVSRAADGPAELAMQLDENWVLTWFSGGKGWDRCKFMKDYRAGQFFKAEVPPLDVPFLIVFQHPPAKVAIAAEGLAILGAAPLENVVVMPLFGSGKPSPQVTAAWAKGLPEDVLKRCRFWSAASRRFPVYCQEDYQVDEPQDVVRTRQKFTYFEIRDDWKTEGRRIAPLSPITALALQSGFAVRMSGAELTDLNHVTHWGPYLFVDNADTNTYEVAGILKYIDEAEVTDVARIDRNAEGFAEAEKLLFKFPTKVDDNALRDLRGRIEGGYTFAQGVAVIAAWMRALPLEPPPQQAGLKEALKRLDPIRTRFFEPKHYSLVPVNVGRRTLHVRVARPGAQTCSQDLVKETSCFPYYLWEYGYYSGDWETIREGWEFIKSTFGLSTMLGWANQAPLYTAEHTKAGGTKLGPIGLARLGKRFGDQASYDLGAHLLAKALMNEWAWNVAAVPYIRKNQPWYQPLEEDMIVHELHGFCGVELMAGSQENTYNEIPLVLDRFNMDHAPLRQFNEFYVKSVAKYFPDRILSSWQRTPVKTLDELLKMTPKQMLGDIGAKNFGHKLSHVHPDFYTFPVKIMEFSAPKRYERLHPKGAQAPEWRRGLDTLTGGMDWRQLVMPLIVREKAPPAPPPSATWPYPGWYLMLPPRVDGKAFRNDVLPLGAITTSPSHRLSGQRQEHPNWNTRIVSWEAAEAGAAR